MFDVFCLVLHITSTWHLLLYVIVAWLVKVKL